MSIRSNAELMAVIRNPRLSTRAVERETGVARSHVAKIRRELTREEGWRREAEAATASAPVLDSTATEQASVEVDADGGEFRNVRSEQPISDWGPIFSIFGLDPEQWIVIDDTIRMSMWQQSKRLENGDRDTINLYSYRARFAPRTTATITDDDLEGFRATLWSNVPPHNESRDTAAPDRPEVTAVLNLADMQLGKGEPQDTIERVKTGVERFVAYVESRRGAGINITEIAVVNNGDPFENIAGNYANQANTVMRGGLRAQMRAVLDVWTWVAGRVYPLAPKGRFVSVLCNHTQFGRSGGSKDAITGDSDNGGAFLAEVLERIIADRFPHVEFTIPNDEMNVYATLSGVLVGFNHGHKIPGKGAEAFERWLGGQVRYDRDAYAARVWITAHKHHYAAWDMGSAFVYQCPSCDGGLAEIGRSKWLTDTTGQHARSGLFGCLVGNHDPLGTSDAVFL